MMTRRRMAGILAVLAVLLAVVVFRWLRGPGDEAEVETDVAVHVGQVGRATLHRYVTAYGYVEPAPPAGSRPAAGALITPFVGGVLAAIDCVEGQRVAKGTVLFRLDSRMAEVAVEQARHELDFAEKAYARQRELVQADGTSQRTYQEAQQRLDAARSGLATAETELAYLRIAAPLPGTVVRVNAEVGQHVDQSTVLAQVVDLDRLIVSVAVPMGEAAGLAAGQAAFLGVDSAAPRGAVTLVGRDVDPATGTYRVLVSVPAGAGYLPGQFTDVRIVVEEHRDVLAVPEVSVVTRPGEGTWVMVVEGDRAVRRPVTVGLRQGGLAEVSGDGIAEGTTVVAEDAYSLPEETKIRIVGR